MNVIDKKNEILDILNQFDTVKMIKPNYYEIPVTAYPFTEENCETFNTLVCWLKASEFFRIVRTKSGGICVDKAKGAKFPAFDVRAARLGVELTIRMPNLNCYRIQLRNSSKELFDSEGNKMKINGKTAFYKFRELCEKDFGINLDSYIIQDKEERKKIKESIEPAKIDFYSQRQALNLLFGDHNKPLTVTNAFHIDFHSSYMSGLANTHPEFKQVVEYLYENRKKDNVYYKAILNMTFGFMQSMHYGYRLAHLSRDMIADNNRRIEKLTNDLINDKKAVLAYNTDGIWYYSPNGKPYHGEGEGEGIGKWSNDHCNCKIRFKSKGCYEYIEDGVYHPVVRGLTEYDKVEPDRTKWQWGDIFRNDCKIIEFELKNDYLYFNDKMIGVIDYEEI